MGLPFFFLPNFPGATFIQGATFIPDSSVCTKTLKGFRGLKISNVLKYFWFPHILWVYLTRKTCGQHWFTSLNIYYIGLGHPNVQWLIRFETWHKKIDSNQRVVPILVTYTVTLIFVWIRCQSEGTIWILNWSLPIPKKSWFGAAIWFQEGLKDNILKQKKSNSKFDWQIWWLKLLYKAWTRPRIIHQG